MGQLEEEIEDASRGRKVSTPRPEDDADKERRIKETEKSFQKVSDDRNAHQQAET